MEAIEAFSNCDTKALIDKLTVYASLRLKTVGIRDFEGKEPVDIVADLIEKVLNGTRKWDSSNSTFEEFLFGVLKSEIYSFFKKNKYISDDEIAELEVEYIDEEEFLQKRNDALILVKKSGADNEELLLLELWIDGITKPSQIAKILEVKPEDVYVITKRLRRRIHKIEGFLIKTV